VNIHIPTKAQKDERTLI